MFIFSPHFLCIERPPTPSRRAHHHTTVQGGSAPGAALAWHGSSVHWGGACSTHAEAEPRSSLTAVLRLRAAPRTQLQQGQQLPELEAGALPLSLADRLRYVASALLVYSYWFSLGSGVLPPEMLGGVNSS